MKRCKHCNKRIFLDETSKYITNHVWKHYGYGNRECEGLRLKYAEPKESTE